MMVNGDASKGDCGTSNTRKDDGGSGDGVVTGVFVEMQHSLRSTISMPYTRRGICYLVLSMSFT